MILERDQTYMINYNLELRAVSANYFLVANDSMFAN